MKQKLFLLSLLFVVHTQKSLCSETKLNDNTEFKTLGDTTFPEGDITISRLSPKKSSLKKSRSPSRSISLGAYDYIFNQEWPPKTITLQDVTITQLSLPDLNAMSALNLLKRTINNKTKNSNYYFLAFLATSVIIPYIKKLDFDFIQEILDCCAENKLHNFTSPRFHDPKNQDNEENLIQKALNTAKNNIQKKMKLQISDYIENFSVDSSPKKQRILARETTKELSSLYSIANQLKKLHDQIFDSIETSKFTEETILQTFFPNHYTITQNLKNNPSILTQEDSKDGFNKVTF